MADIPTKSRSSRPRPRARVRPVIKTYPDPDPTLAFGFVLHDECRLRWARYFLDECEKDEDDSTKLTSEQFEEERISLMHAVNTTLPDHIYSILPNLPRLRSDLLPVENGELAYNRWVFALRDNSTSKNLHSPLTREHIDAVRNELGLADSQQPQWVRVPMCVQWSC